jgi:hypothetical protein
MLVVTRSPRLGSAAFVDLVLIRINDIGSRICAKFNSYLIRRMFGQWIAGPKKDRRKYRPRLRAAEYCGWFLTSSPVQDSDYSAPDWLI